MKPQRRISKRLDKLQEHLENENPMLVSIVDQYREIDKLGRKMGLLQPDESYATQISWWPMISVLGTFSAGKSSFINSYVGFDLQETGNQAVDDRFTVISYSKGDTLAVLPGLALDGDPRFPFYQISHELNKVVPGEGDKVDKYLQLKVAPTESLKGKILIDSPGFDADEQRKSTLRITDHIIELSDLVLILFDARHPEPGAMQDTLEHLVKGAARRNDSSKFIFILNQIDSSAKDDNMEKIVSAWQKALVQNGLNTGEFITLYNEDIVEPFEDKALWERYKTKRDKNYAKLTERMNSIETERVYRIIGSMELLANQIEQQTVPALSAALKQWRRRVLIADVIILGGSLISVGVLLGLSGLLNDQSLSSIIPLLVSNIWWGVAIGVIALIGVLWVHRSLKIFFAKQIVKKLNKNITGNLASAFVKSTASWRSILNKQPAGWGWRGKNMLDSVRINTDSFIQQLNDVFAMTSSKK